MLRRRDVANRFEQPAVIEPIDLFEVSVLDLFEICQGPRR
jgi:hypothetical protein